MNNSDFDKEEASYFSARLEAGTHYLHLSKETLQRLELSRNLLTACAAGSVFGTLALVAMQLVSIGTLPQLYFIFLLLIQLLCSFVGVFAVFRFDQLVRRTTGLKQTIIGVSESLARNLAAQGNRRLPGSIRAGAENLLEDLENEARHLTWASGWPLLGSREGSGLFLILLYVCMPLITVWLSTVFRFSSF